MRSELLRLGRQLINGSYWAMQPERFTELLAVVRARLLDLKISDESLAALAARGDAKAKEPRSASSVGVIPIRGVIFQHSSWFEEYFGIDGGATDKIASTLKSMLADESISAIILDVDSPGGTVYGVAELAEEIFQARGKKPIVAVANSLAASAAYWIASAADEIVVTPGGEVGSIGVYAMHVDMSKWLEDEGLKVSFVQFGENKTEGNPYEPLSKEARAQIQKRVDEYGDMFVAAVARGRETTAGMVKKRFGQGRMFGAEEAVEIGMADRVATLEEMAAKMAPGKYRRTRRAPKSEDLTVEIEVTQPMLDAAIAAAAAEIVTAKIKRSEESQAAAEPETSRRSEKDSARRRLALHEF